MIFIIKVILTTLTYILRAAMKMANIDAVTEYMFTKPTYEDGVSKIVTTHGPLMNNS